jgi:hypothetical protein
MCSGSEEGDRDEGFVSDPSVIKESEKGDDDDHVMDPSDRRAHGRKQIVGNATLQNPDGAVTPRTVKNMTMKKWARTCACPGR